MRASRRGAAFVASFEACYLFTYRDSAGILTDGIGNTAAAGIRAPRPGGRVTLAQALAEFERSLERYGDRVQRAVHIPLLQHQLDALTSFDFNTGAVASGTVDDRLNVGDVDGALAVLGRYVNAGGKRLRGLEDRRRAEAALFRSGIYPNRPVLVVDAPGTRGRAVPYSQLAGPAPALELGPPPPMPERAPSQNFLLDILKWLWSLAT